MKKQVLISGAGFAGLTLAYWLNQFGFEVTVVEYASGLRRGGSPIDIRGKALEVVKEMGLWEQIKAKEFIHTDEIVNAQGETLVRFSLNKQPEYLGDIEIHRGDLLDIIYDTLPKDSIKILFNTSIASLVEQADAVKVVFEDGSSHLFDYVFGADGTHSTVRRLVFGEEHQFTQFFGAYFAFAETQSIDTGRSKDTGVMYRLLGKQALVYQFLNGANGVLMFRSPKLDWDYRNKEQHKQILKDHFGNERGWKVPEILEAMLHSDSLFFDEVCQVHVPQWYKGRVALVGDAAHAPSFFTGMGTSLAMIGATCLANSLASHTDYQTAFARYQEQHKPFAEEVQSRIVQNQKYQLPETEDELKASIERFKKIQDSYRSEEKLPIIQF